MEFLFFFFPYRPILRGSKWGINGLAKVKMGSDNGGLESQCSFGVIDVDRSTFPSGLEAIISPIKIDNLRSKLNLPDKKVAKGTYWTTPTAFPNPDGKQIIKSPLPHTYVNFYELPKSYDPRDINGIDYTTELQNQHVPS